jgi:hypothetical protein
MDLSELKESIKEKILSEWTSLNAVKIKKVDLPKDIQSYLTKMGYAFNLKIIEVLKDDRNDKQYYDVSATVKEPIFISKLNMKTVFDHKFLDNLRIDGKKLTFYFRTK